MGGGRTAADPSVASLPVLAMAGYQYSLDYAKERPQGRKPSSKDPNSDPVMLIEHADVRRMLLAQKAYAEGAWSLCLFASCMNISARILPEVTPAGIIKLIIKAKNFIFHSGDGDMPEPQSPFSEVCNGIPQPPPSFKPASSAKNRDRSRVEPDAGVTVR